MPRPTLASLVSKALEESGWTVRDGAAATGLHHGTIARIAKGEIRWVTDDRLEALAAGLDVPVEELRAAMPPPVPEVPELVLPHHKTRDLTPQERRAVEGVVRAVERANALIWGPAGPPPRTGRPGARRGLARTRPAKPSK